jgi:hypothetical protein
VVCLAPRAPGDSVRPRRLSDVVARPLNFPVGGVRDAPVVARRGRRKKVCARGA